MNKTELFDILSETRFTFDSALAEVDPAHMTIPGIVGEWSVKDIIAHVTWSVKETVGMLEAKALVGSDLWRLPEEQRNAAVYEQNLGRTLSDVMAESQRAHRKLVDLIEEIPEHDILNADWFAGLPGGEWPPWRVIQVNVSDHYVHHTKDIQEAFPLTDELLS
jgi:hypothetical protein